MNLEYKFILTAQTTSMNTEYPVKIFCLLMNDFQRSGLKEAKGKRILRKQEVSDHHQPGKRQA
jgi:hypothetical protein